MSYNEIPNILVDSVTIPNKPFSNLEIIGAATRLSVNCFRAVFLRDTLPTKTKLKECGILKLDSPSGDGTDWRCGSRKVRKSSIYEVQPPSELIAYLKPPIFYNSERVQQNGEMFCGHLCIFALKQLSLGNNIQDVINYLMSL